MLAALWESERCLLLTSQCVTSICLMSAVLLWMLVSLAFDLYTLFFAEAILLVSLAFFLFLMFHDRCYIACQFNICLMITALWRCYVSLADELFAYVDCSLAHAFVMLVSLTFVLY